MENIHRYLNDCLNKTFLDHPIIKDRQYNSCLERAVEKSIFDYNIKYAGRSEISTETDLAMSLQLEPTIEAVFMYRFEREIFINDPNDPLLSFLASMMHRRTGCEIYYSTEIGKGLNIQHGFGIVIGPRFKIGDNFTIHQGVTLGQKNLNSPNEKIIIGDNVTLFAGASVLGNITIGDNTKVGANSLLLDNADPDSIYVGSPAKKIR